MADYREIIALEASKKADVGGKDLLQALASIFDLTSDQIGAMFSPPKSGHTVNGYRRKGFTELPQEGQDEIINFIERNYKGKRPKDNLVGKITKILKSIDNNQ